MSDKSGRWGPPSGLSSSNLAAVRASVGLGLMFVLTALPMHSSHGIPKVNPEITGSIATSGGYYLSAWQNGGIGGPNSGPGATPLHTDATKLGPWERFSIIFLDGTHFALRTADGRYVTAVNGGGGGTPSPTIAIGTIKLAGVRGSNETFTLTSLGGGKVAIKTYDGHFVTAVNGGGFGGPNDVPIHTDAKKRGAWERFTWVPPGDPLHTHGSNSPDSPPSCLSWLRNQTPCPAGP